MSLCVAIMHKGVQPSCHCRPAHVIVRPSMSVCVLGCHCLSKLVSACHCLSKLVHVCHCLSKLVSAGHWLFVTHHAQRCPANASLLVSAHHCPPKHVCVRLVCHCLSKLVSVCHCLSKLVIYVSARPWVSLHAIVRPYHAQRRPASVSLSTSACH